MTQEKPGQWRASKLNGLDVYNNDNEKVGDIREVLFNRDGKAEAVVIGVGGFLGRLLSGFGVVGLGSAFGGHLV